MANEPVSKDQEGEAISPHQLREISGYEPTPVGETDSNSQQFQIRLANALGSRESASLLIKKMYSWRGYDTSALNQDPNKLTLAAHHIGNDSTVLGTLTLGWDSPTLGIAADELYHSEAESLRCQGKKLCDITRLAVDMDVKSRRLMPALFHIAYIYAMNIYSCTDTLIEVNPRHVVFYERMLGFKQFGPERICPRVNAPAVLLRLEVSYMSEQIEKYGGLGASVKGVKSIYPYFFSPKDEKGITHRLLRDGFGPITSL
jgi:hypothetical protein